MSQNEDFLLELEAYINSLPSKPDLSNAGVKLHPDCPCCLPDHDTLCYASLWVALQTNSELPPNIHARMILGPMNKWVEIYAKIMGSRKNLPRTVESMFDLAG